ncbi:MAG: DMT family transporter [Desulfobulbaceae bacterium]|nr:DMT family transporter [Desulfobulbaceae bacterium]
MADLPSGVRSPLVSTLLAIVACLLWSTAFVGIKIGLRYAPPFSFAGQRFMLAGLLLVPFWWRKSAYSQMILPNLLLILKISFFQTFLLYGLFYIGITMVPGALAAIIIGTAPLITAVLAHFYMDGEGMTPAKMASLGLGVLGVVLISVSRQPWQSLAGMQAFGGIVLLLLSTIASGFGNVLVARDKVRIDPVLLNSVQIFVGGFFLFLISLPLEGLPKIALPWAYYGALVWLALLSAVAFSLWFLLLKSPSVSVSRLNLWKFIIPVCGALLSWALLPGESPSLASVLGMIMIAVAIIAYSLADIRHR